MSRRKYPQRPDLAGILNINKPSGMTSHDVVAAVRRAARVRRVGHTGTLDPMASGVLLVCLDQATRVSQFLMSSDKLYRAQICLGQTTDTDDREGQVKLSRPVSSSLDAATIQKALANFVGEIAQVPPRYAAIKHRGVPLHRLARQGVDVQPTSRKVTIHAIQLCEWYSPMLTVNVHCGPGTYIRALARDLGEHLGCGGHLVDLVRLKSGQFHLEEAVDLGEVVRRLPGSTRQELADILWPLDAALTGMARMTVDAEAENHLRYGRQISGSPPGPDEGQPTLRRSYATDGTLVAIVRYDAHTGLWQPDTVFDLRLPG